MGLAEARSRIYVLKLRSDNTGEDHPQDSNSRSFARHHNTNNTEFDQTVTEERVSGLPSMDLNINKNTYLVKMIRLRVKSTC